MVQLYVIHPIGNLDMPGFGGRPDQSLPGGGPDSPWGRPGGGDHPSQPIYHPGHPEHGLPSGGHISNRLPWSPGHPDAGLPVPPGVTPPAEVPPDLAAKLIVLWRLPNTVEWHGKAMDPSLVAGMPLPPTGEPK